MPKLTEPEKNKFEQAYAEHEKLIRTRQQFENEHPYPPYSELKTTVNFHGLYGRNLLNLSCRLGNLDRVKAHITEGAKVESDDPLARSSALEIAFFYGYLDIVDYLLANGANLDKIYMHNIDLPHAKDKYSQIVKTFILTEENIKFRNRYNYTSNKLQNKNRNYLNYAIEIGDIELLNNLLESNKNTNSLQIMFRPLNFEDSIAEEIQSGIENPLFTAIKNNNIEALKLLLAYLPADLGPSIKKYFDTALHIAACYDNWECAELLLTKRADINKKNALGQTPLFSALENGNEKFALQLIARGADTACITDFNESIFHAAKSCSNECLEALKATVKDKTLMTLKNVFGQTPMASHAKASLDQSNLIKKFIYYHQLNYRSQDYISYSGYCAGLAFLHGYFQNKPGIFYALREAISKWDGKRDSLQMPLSMPLLETFRSLEDLFEHVISWATWYQHLTLTTETGIHQGEVDKLYNGSVDYALKTSIFKNISSAQLEELLTIFSLLPKQTNFICGGEEHGVSLVKADDDKFIYFDANLNKDIDKPLTPAETAQLLLATKYKRLLGEDINSITFSAYAFDKDDVNLRNFNSFLASELPKTSDEALAFQHQSANNFTHLHIALLTNSVENIKELLNSKHNDINASDAQGNTVFKTALLIANVEACKLLMNSSDLIISDKTATIAYYNCKEILPQILKDNRTKDMRLLFLSALKAGDYIIARELIDLKKIGGEIDVLSICLNLINSKHSESLQFLIENLFLVQSLDEGSKINQFVYIAELLNNLISLPNHQQLAELLLKSLGDNLYDFFEFIIINNYITATLETICSTNILVNMSLSVEKAKDIIKSLDYSELSDSEKSLCYQKLFANLKENLLHPIDNNITYLHGFAGSDNLLALQALLPFVGSNIDIKIDGGNTALHIALTENTGSEIISLLLDHGADIHMKNDLGMTPLSMAEANNHPALTLFNSVATNAEEHNRSNLQWGSKI